MLFVSLIKDFNGKDNNSYLCEARDNGFEGKTKVCEAFIPPSLRIKASHAFVFPSKPKFGIPSS